MKCSENVLVDGCVEWTAQWTNTSRWHGSPNQHRLWKLHTGLQASWIVCLSILPPDSGTLVSKWDAKFALIRKEDFGPLCFIKSRVNAAVYQDIFRALHASFIFQQDLHLPTLPKEPKPGSMTMVSLCNYCVISCNIQIFWNPVFCGFYELEAQIMYK